MGLGQYIGGYICSRYILPTSVQFGALFWDIFCIINVAFCTFCFVLVLGLFGFNLFIYRAFGAFSFFAIFVPPILLFINI
uniref:Uncharacterized protein n=1 Tax=Myoviridae sp. ctlHW5 TaxID=2826691 RepID=A0A8S5N8I8_9CAUD|nr:MAG TPA: hypothetical protein [Myoviridae sp. ctlHW5]